LTLQASMTRLAAALLCYLAMTQQDANAAEPWRTNLDPTTETRTFLLWEDGAPGARERAMMTSPL